MSDRNPENGDDSGHDEPASEGAGTEGEEASSVPLSGLREDIEARRKRRRESPPEPEDVFEEVAEEPVIDGEQVWEDLLAGQDEDAGLLAFAERVEGEAEDVRIIPDRICHNCQYFGEPPELHCTHEGTEIRRVVDMEHFEVVECPVVKNRSDLRGQ